VEGTSFASDGGMEDERREDDGRRSDGEEGRCASKEDERNKEREQTPSEEIDALGLLN
jgi:hypothetical protein